MYEVVTMLLKVLPRILEQHYINSTLNEYIDTLTNEELTYAKNMLLKDPLTDIKEEILTIIEQELARRTPKKEVITL